MHIKNWIVAHFSHTGGTKKIADAIATGFGTPATEKNYIRISSHCSLNSQHAEQARLSISRALVVVF